MAAASYAGRSMLAGQWHVSTGVTALQSLCRMPEVAEGAAPLCGIRDSMLAVMQL